MPQENYKILLLKQVLFLLINSLIEYKHEHFIKLAYCGLNGETH